ncbi:hypothetical protein L3Q82_007322 [Scortum barcoo]|uniref:Uncharacterized protein n=1 Tax=Scortum barcoo TaxID=214431 RepID=A0ACB8WSI2_9TELE|nr:hypothetical protein L3Q82_007322 [Scortum barcoo]
MAVRSLYDDRSKELGSHCQQRSQRPEGVWFGNHRISSILFADDVVLLASLNQDLQHVLGRFAAVCEGSWDENQHLQVRGHGSRLEKGGLPSPGWWRGPDRRIGAASAVMWSVYRTIVVKKEPSQKAKLSIYRSIYAPTLTYGYELWMMKVQDCRYKRPK